MKYLVKDEQLDLIHEAGKGAWTYHIVFRDSKDIKGKWRISKFLEALMGI